MFQNNKKAGRMAYPENPGIFFADPDHLYAAGQGQEDGDSSGLVPGIEALVQVHAADPVAVPDLGVAKHGAQLGERVECDGPVAQDAGLVHPREQEDLLHARARAIETAGGLGILGAKPSGEDKRGGAAGIAGIGGDAEEVEELGCAGADVEVAVCVGVNGQQVAA